MLNKTERDDIAQAVQVLKQGGIVLCPTDTIWGLSCDATNEAAVKKIYAIKQREDSKALIALVDSIQKIDFYVPDVPPVAWDLIDCADRPLTIVYDKVRNLAPNLSAPDGSAALRVVKEEYIRTLCERMKRAIVSTSANISGETTARHFSEIQPEILAAVDYVCQSRRHIAGEGRSSTIIKLTASSEVTIIRP